MSPALATDKVALNDQVELQQLINSETFGPNNWANRRRIIHVTLIICALLSIAIVGVGIAGVLNQGWFTDKAVDYDQGLLDLLGSALWAIMGLVMTVIGTYVFGASYDTNNFRNNIAALAKTANTASVLRDAVPSTQYYAAAPYQQREEPPVPDNAQVPAEYSARPPTALDTVTQVTQIMDNTVGGQSGMYPTAEGM